MKKTALFGILILYVGNVLAVDEEKVVECGTRPPSEFASESSAIFGAHRALQQMLSHEWMPHSYPGDDCVNQNRPRLSAEKAVEWCESMYRLDTVAQKIYEAEETLVRYRKALPTATAEELKYQHIHGQDAKLEKALNDVKKNQSEIEANLQMRLKKLKK
jgi:hypothetical protein